METRGSRRKRIRQEQLASMVTEDRISNLPEPLIHEIISCLPARAAARLSILSKKWQYFFENLRSINFNLEEFRDESGRIIYWKIHQFMIKYLSPYNRHVLQRVRFASHFVFHAKLDNHIGRCIDLAIDGRIQELDLSFWHTHRAGCYCFLFPAKFFQSPLHVTVLKLEGCRVWKTQFAGFPVVNMISLKNSHISDGTLQDLVHASPKLQTLIVESCNDVHKISLISNSLRRLVLKRCPDVVSVYMDLPLLNTFEYTSYEGTDRSPWAWTPVTEFKTPKDVMLENLGSLYLSHTVLDISTLQHIFAISPNLDDVRMNRCEVCNGPIAVRGDVKKFIMVDVYHPELIEGFASCLENLDCDSGRHCRGSTSYTPGSVTFHCLTSLTLGGFFLLSDEALGILISSCPVLENLIIRKCLSLRRVELFCYYSNS